MCFELSYILKGDSCTETYFCTMELVWAPKYWAFYKVCQKTVDQIDIINLILDSLKCGKFLVESSTKVGSHQFHSFTQHIYLPGMPGIYLALHLEKLVKG